MKEATKKRLIHKINRNYALGEWEREYWRICGMTRREGKEWLKAKVGKTMKERAR